MQDRGIVEGATRIHVLDSNFLILLKRHMINKGPVQSNPGEH